MKDDGLTAFPKTEEWLRNACAGAELDIPAFHRPLARCDLSHCRGMCCYDGVYVDGGTAEVLRRVSRSRAAYFRENGVAMPREVIVEGVWLDQSAGPKTATRPTDLRGMVEGFPGHFENTCCVFRADDGRCTLQTLGLKDGRHPWFYKPLTCWLHPIHVSPERITIFDEKTDPYRFPEYDGFLSRTFCGQTAPLGRPAYQVLRPELEFLGRLLDRDLMSPFGLIATRGI